MNIEESISATFLEKLSLREAALIEFGGQKKSIIQRQLAANSIPMYQPYRLDDYKLFYNNRTTESPAIRKQLAYIFINRLESNIELYDTDKYSRAYALSKLWNDGHSLRHGNSYHYFNPFTLRLEPILTILPFQGVLKKKGYFREKRFNPQVVDIFQELIERNALASIEENYMDDLLSVSSTIDESLAEMQSIFPLDEKIQLGALLSLICRK